MTIIQTSPLLETIALVFAPGIAVAILWCPMLLIGRSLRERFSHRDHGLVWIVSSFVAGECNDEAKAQSED